MSTNNPTMILQALEACLQALQNIPTTEFHNYQAEIDKANEALIVARNFAKQEIVEIILGGLYLLEFERDHILYRVTTEDFADLLADRLTERGILPSELVPEELAALVDQAADYLNGEGMPWVDVINIALTDAWPERLKGSIQ